VSEGGEGALRVRTGGGFWALEAVKWTVEWTKNGAIGEKLSKMFDKTKGMDQNKIVRGALIVPLRKRQSTLAKFTLVSLLIMSAATVPMTTPRHKSH